MTYLLSTLASKYLKTILEKEMDINILVETITTIAKNREKYKESIVSESPCKNRKELSYINESDKEK